MQLDKRRSIIYRLFGAGNLDEVAIAYSVIGDQPGTMLDVGAQFGTSLAPFLEHGWTVYAFEPDPSNRAKLTSNYPKALVDPRAVSEIDGETLPFFTSDVSTGISTLSPFHSSHKPTAEVKTVRLDTFIRDRGIEKVDFLKTDVEGFDLFALRTFPWETHRPRAVVCEFEDNKTRLLGYSSAELAEFLQEKGYAIIVSEWFPVIRYGGNHTWKQFKHYPTDIPGDSNGNFIAVEPRLLPQFDRACETVGRNYRGKRKAERLLRLT